MNATLSNRSFFVLTVHQTYFFHNRTGRCSSPAN